MGNEGDAEMGDMREGDLAFRFCCIIKSPGKWHHNHIHLCDLTRFRATQAVRAGLIVTPVGNLI